MSTIPLGDAAIGSPNLVDSPAIDLATDRIHNMSIGVPLSISVSIGAGLAVSSYVDSLFITNHAYIAQTQPIYQLAAARANLEQANHTLQGDDINAATPYATGLSRDYTSAIALVQRGLSHGYQPNVQGLADAGAFITPVVLVAAALYGASKHHSQRDH